MCLGQVSAQRGVCLPRWCTPPPPHVDRILDTRFGKQYLSATLFADGNDSLMDKHD